MGFGKEKGVSKLISISTFTLAAFSLPACAERPLQVPQGNDTTQTTAGPDTAVSEEQAMSAGQMPADKFATLDDYLAFLKKGGEIDKPWYREVSPGVYELVTTYRPVGGDQRPQRFTREELERKFGFDR
jgi:hypothetical protein